MSNNLSSWSSPDEAEAKCQEKSDCKGLKIDKRYNKAILRYPSKVWTADTKYEHKSNGNHQILCQTRITQCSVLSSDLGAKKKF